MGFLRDQEKSSLLNSTCKNFSVKKLISRLCFICAVGLLLSACATSSSMTGTDADTVVDKLRLVYNEESAEATQVGVTASNNGELVAFAYDNGTIKIVDLTVGRAIKKVKANLTDLFDVRFNYNGTKLILAGNQQEVEILDIETGKIVHRFELPNELNRVAVSQTDDYVAFGIKDGEVHIYDLTTNKKIQKLEPGKHHVSGLDFDPNGEYIAVSVLSRLRNRNPARIYDIRSGKVAHKIKKSVYTGLSYTQDGGQLTLMAVEGIVPKTKVFSYDLTTGSRAEAYKKANMLSVAILTSAEIYGNYMLGGTVDETFDVIDMNTGKKAYTTKRGKVKLGQAFWNIGIDKKRIYRLFDGQSFLINYSDNNINQIYNAEANSISGFLYSDANNDFAVVARDGRMEGSSEAISNVAWSKRKSNKRVPLEATFDQFYTPNLIQSLLSDESVDQDITSLEKAVELAPDVEITRPDSIFTADQSKLQIEVSARSNGDPVKEIQISVNGKPVDGDQRGLKVAGSRRTAEVELIPGRSTISAVAITEGGYRSRPDRVQVNYEGPTAESNLYVLAVGIDEYKNNSYNLNYATTDAGAFVEEVRSKAGSIFDDIQVSNIADDEATKQRVEQAINSIRQKARPQDMFVFYYAGHGVMSEGNSSAPGDFYLALHDVTQLYGSDQMLADRGISAAELREAFGDIEARKQLIVLDACQSGGAVETFAMRGAAEEKAMIQLARSTGITLLASTGTEQFATEFEQLGHGVFTYSILDGLSGKADGGSRDGKITVKELEAYLNDTVPELTQEYKGTVQYPRSWSQGMDFPIGVIK